jgi:hypothetical protein
MEIKKNSLVRKPLFFFPDETIPYKINSKVERVATENPQVTF